MAVPYTFGSATSSIPLSQLDSNFATGITLGNTAIQLGNTVTTLNNMTLANVTISSGTSNLASTSISNGTSNVTIASSGGNISMATNGTTAITVSTSQKVGIGTTSPTGILNVKGTGGDALPATSGSTQSAGLVTRLQQGGGIGSVMDIGGNGGGGSWIQVTEASNLATNYNLLLNPNGGNLLVGTTTNSLSTKIFTNSNIGAQQTYGPMFISNEDNTDNVGRNSFTFQRGGVQVGAITTNNTNATYGTSSDYRLKENIQPMTGALNTVSRLKPVTYKWKPTGSDGQGFIAHELQEIVFDCVTGTKDAVDEDGKPIYQNVDTSFLVATLTAAIQELKAINDTQAETINALTARIVVLESK
jgi:hypothetical protein